jgi:hypothetical protein
MPMGDEWSGLADLLAGLIEKYASELGIEELPDSKDDGNPKSFYERGDCKPENIIAYAVAA